MGCPQSQPINKELQHSMTSLKIKELKEKYQQDPFTKENVDDEREMQKSFLKENRSGVTKVSSKKTANSLFNDLSQIQGTRNNNNRHEQQMFDNSKEYEMLNILDGDQRNMVLEKVDKFQKKELMDPNQKKQMYNRVKIQKSRIQTYEVLSQFQSVNESVRREMQQEDERVSQINWGDYIDNIQQTIGQNNMILMKNTQIDANPQFISAQQNQQNADHNEQQIQIKEDFNSVNEIKFQIYNHLNSMNNVQQFQSKQD